jgi:hypothetical protein
MKQPSVAAALNLNRYHRRRCAICPKRYENTKFGTLNKVADADAESNEVGG